MKQQGQSEKKQVHLDHSPGKKKTAADPLESPPQFNDPSGIYQNLFQANPEGMMILDAETGRIVDVNKGLTDLLQCSRDEFLKQNIQDLFAMDDFAQYQASVADLRVHKKVCHQFVPLKTKDGSRLNISFECHLFTSDRKEFISCNIRRSASPAVTDSKSHIIDQIREHLNKSGHLLIWTAGLDKKCDYVNAAWNTFTGRPPGAELGDGRFENIHPDDLNPYLKTYTESFDKHETFSLTYRLRQASGEYRWMKDEGMPRYDDQGTFQGYVGHCQDITEFMNVEEALRKSEIKYRTIIENSQEGIFQTSVDGRQMTVNMAFADILGYDSAEECAHSLSNINEKIYVDPNEYYKVMKTILREGSIRGYETEFYRKDRSRIWVNMSVNAVRDSQGNMTYYHGIVEDITPKKKLEQERQDSIVRLRRSLGATIHAMSATVEARDPYTAGHQRRVADLARTIATEMELHRDLIDGIRLAGMIHDIGKISVPSEILTKPTRLTELEFELIKTHAEAGFNILKDIEFPWPIARIVLEHHERIDGSGYPQGIKGDEILLESKIISVADVIEAISSHRPYRPAFGIEPALEEIEKNKGILYDQAVSEACLKIFRENRYKMPF